MVGEGEWGTLDGVFEGVLVGAGHRDVRITEPNLKEVRGVAQLHRRGTVSY